MPQPGEEPGCLVLVSLPLLLGVGPHLTLFMSLFHLLTTVGNREYHHSQVTDGDTEARRGYTTSSRHTAVRGEPQAAAPSIHAQATQCSLWHSGFNDNLGCGCAPRNAGGTEADGTRRGTLWDALAGASPVVICDSSDGK